MTGDFWYGFWVWLLALGIPILVVPIGGILGLWPEASGRYGRTHLRWFKWSLIFNLVGWMVTGVLWITTVTYLANVQTQNVLAMRQDLADRFATALGPFQESMQKIEARSLTGQAPLVAAEEELA